MARKKSGYRGITVYLEQEIAVELDKIRERTGHPLSRILGDLARQLVLSERDPIPRAAAPPQPVVIPRAVAIALEHHLHSVVQFCEFLEGASYLTVSLMLVVAKAVRDKQGATE